MTVNSFHVKFWFPCRCAISRVDTICCLLSYEGFSSQWWTGFVEQALFWAWNGINGIVYGVVFSWFHELIQIQSRGVCRLCVCPFANFFAQIATTTPKMARSLPNLHRMVITWARIQVVLKVEVKVKGHVIGALLCRSRKSLLLAGK